MLLQLGLAHTTYQPDRWLVVSASSLAVTTFGRPLPGAPLLGGSPR
jgi:hypothetical protein